MNKIFINVWYLDGPGNVTVTTQPVPQQPYPTHGGPPPAGAYGAPSYPPSMPQPGL